MTPHAYGAPTGAPPSSDKQGATMYRPNAATVRVARILTALHYVDNVSIIPGSRRLTGGRKPPVFRVTYQPDTVIGPSGHPRVRPGRVEDVTAELARDWAEAEMRANRHLAAEIDGVEHPQEDWADYVARRDTEEMS